MISRKQTLTAATLALWMAGGIAPLVAAPTTRPSACAGTWYPAEREALAAQVDKLLSQGKSDKAAGKPLAIIAPHAGYRFSAPVAAAAYAQLRGQSYKRVIVLAFSHRYSHTYRGVSLPEWTDYQTPLGTIPIDVEAVATLRQVVPFVTLPGIDREEHSLELQLPFLQRTISQFRLLPLMVGEMSPDGYAQAGAALHPYLDEDTLIVASSDFTHFGPGYGYQPFQDDLARRLEELAGKAAAAVQACDFDGLAGHLAATQDTICGQRPILLLLRTLSMGGGASGLRAGFDTSGHITGDYTNSVTYQSFVFNRRRGTVEEADRAALLALARQTVTAYLNHRDLPKPEASKLPAGARKDGACFVTLENHGELRGCIGNMQARGPLYQAVMENAVNACQDFRFVSNPVTAGELDKLTIEISYLTPFKRVGKPEEIVIGRHGLLISLDGQRGVLLPQVAYERGWTRDVFLAQVCHKAGLPPDAWKKPETELYSFEAEVFREKEPTTRPAGEQK